MPKKLTKDVATELVRIASEKRIGAPGPLPDDAIDLGMMVEDSKGQYGVTLEDDEWYSTKSLGRRLKGRPIEALGGKSFTVVTRHSERDNKPHVYMIPKN